MMYQHTSAKGYSFMSSSVPVLGTDVTVWVRDGVRFMFSGAKVKNWVLFESFFSSERY